MGFLFFETGSHSIFLTGLKFAIDQVSLKLIENGLSLSLMSPGIKCVCYHAQFKYFSKKPIGNFPIKIACIKKMFKNNDKFWATLKMLYSQAPLDVLISCYFVLFFSILFSLHLFRFLILYDSNRCAAFV